MTQGYSTKLNSCVHQGAHSLLAFRGGRAGGEAQGHKELPVDTGYWKWLAAHTKALRQDLHLSSGCSRGSLRAGPYQETK